MKQDKELGRLILEVVESQLTANEPPETQATLDRLVTQGIAVEEAKRLIACVVSSEIFETLKLQNPYDHERYVAALNRLPRLPWD
ncbi:MAG: hypothetical protein WA655_19955 [Candidatus Korobacteraceae bacterium]